MIRIRETFESSENVTSSIEKSANYEGSHALLFKKRLENKEVRQRLIDDLYLDLTTGGRLTDLPDEVVELILEDNKVGIRKYIEKELKEKIKSVFSITGIVYSPFGHLASNKGSGFDDEEGYEKGGVVGILPKGMEPFDPSIKESILTKNIAEAHEKGHLIRSYWNESELREKVLNAFDLARVSFTDAEIDSRMKIWNDGQEERFQIHDKEVFVKKLLNAQFTTDEIIERMSQLKNYFGMSGTEVFTKKHLEYTKKNYIKDTGMVASQIQPFFDAISDDDIFVELMNTLGI